MFNNSELSNINDNRMKQLHAHVLLLLSKCFTFITFNNISTVLLDVLANIVHYEISMDRGSKDVLYNKLS